MIAGVQIALLYAAPAALLLLALVCGRYPGERLIARLTRALHRRRRPTSSRSAPPGPARKHAGGGRLLALRLAGRGPPAAVA